MDHANQACPWPLAFVPYHLLDGRPNVIVDGSATDGTVLVLSHWPNAPAPPPGLERDLSAEMAVAYLDEPGFHGPAALVSNNHFDQDGLVSLYALTDPAGAQRLGDLLVDLAAAGDFAVYRHRDAARASMVLAAYADPDRSPLGPAPDDYAEWTGTLYEELLGRLPELVEYPERYRTLWADEDARLSESEQLVTSGRVSAREDANLDLAVVDVPGDGPTGGGHRFGGQWCPGLHPMAIYNALRAFTVLTVRGRQYEVVYRYETWVQYRSRRPRPRVDLRPLAAELNEIEKEGQWVFDGVSALTPRLHLVGADESSIGASRFEAMLRRHLSDSSPAWDPYGSVRKA
ncbi:MAG TPA: DUF6687 family protein [Acidimicrobiales bacterium]|nr:DUF6687 family protein [Acidimicrobiales bacterium]